MAMRAFFLLFFLFTLAAVNTQDMTQDTLPYQEIGDYPPDFGPGSMLARYVDGMGYRYFWATDGLRQVDLDYRPSQDASSTLETLEHIHGLSATIANFATNTPNTRSAKEEMTLEEIRSATLHNFKGASTAFAGKTEAEMAQITLKFQRGDEVNSMDFWLGINGPLSDALYHIGQVVSFRRTAGNPLHPGVSVFRGKTRL
jgi:hypothetical protein